MSDEQLKKGQDLMRQAKSKANSGGGMLSKIFSGGNKTEEAAELYVRAGNAFKMGKLWNEAGNAFENAAQLHSKRGSKHESATSYVDAANCYRKQGADEAVECLKRAIDIYTDMGRFTIAAKHHMSIGEIYEELKNAKSAAEQYQKAADYYSGEESKASASKCVSKVAYLSADAGDLVKAANLFEQLGKEAMENSLLKYGAKDHFFRASLCHLNIDAENCNQALKKYAEFNPAFTDSREYKLMQKLLEAANPDEPNADAFAEAIADYDSISRLDPWTVRLLNNVKKTLLADEPELA